MKIISPAVNFTWISADHRRDNRTESVCPNDRRSRLLKAVRVEGIDWLSPSREDADGDVLEDGERLTGLSSGSAEG